MFDARAKALILSVALLLTGAGLMVQPASATSFNNVQIFANPITSKASNFQFAAYNLTGDLVASSQTSFSAAAFELPSGTYLFTATASDYAYPYGYACPLTAQTAPPGGKATSTTAGVIPWCRPPSSEYGYAVADIAGPQTISIALQNASALPTTPVTVKVSYLNGTAAAGAPVYASVVGEWYWGWYENAGLNMSGQTNGNGIAQLIVPVAPVVVTAWKWLPVNVKANTTSEVNVGGQEVNVTAYWEPTYVGLSGSGLVIPPQSSIGITLRYQQPDYWVMSGGAATKSAYVNGSPTASEASQPNGTPSTVSNSAQSSTQGYLPAKIPALQAAGTTGDAPAGPGVETVVIGALAFIAVAIGVVFAARRRARPPTLAG